MRPTFGICARPHQDQKKATKKKAPKYCVLSCLRLLNTKSAETGHEHDIFVIPWFLPIETAKKMSTWRLPGGSVFHKKTRPFFYFFLRRNTFHSIKTNVSKHFPEAKKCPLVLVHKNRHPTGHVDISSSSTKTNVLKRFCLKNGPPQRGPNGTHFEALLGPKNVPMDSILARRSPFPPTWPTKKYQEGTKRFQKNPIPIQIVLTQHVTAGPEF